LFYSVRHLFLVLWFDENPIFIEQSTFLRAVSDKGVTSCEEDVERFWFDEQWRTTSRSYTPVTAFEPLFGFH